MDGGVADECSSLYCYDGRGGPAWLGGSVGGAGVPD